MKSQLVLFCPACCSANDVEAVDGEEIKVDCSNCEQSFRMVVDVERISTNSPA
jgi:hypothetical protein